jgi:hypothetical protein
MIYTDRLGGCAWIVRAVLLAVIVLLCGTDPVPSAEKGAQIPAEGNTKVFLFNMGPATAYSVQKNSAPLATVNASSAGVVVYGDLAASGDRYEISGGGVGADPPTVPTGVYAAGDDRGCVTIDWNANPETDVDFYRLYRGSEPGSYEDSLDVAGTTETVWCHLPDGEHYFAARAHNAAGLLSALSQEVSASVSNGSTQPPLPPATVDAVEGSVGCVEVSWVPSGSPDVIGYVVDFGTQSVAAGDATTYEHTEDAGNTTSHTVCGLNSRTYYVAVRSKNFAGMLSAFSHEDTVEVVPTAVFVTAFSAEPRAGGVELKWEIWTDENLRGYKLYRSQEAGSGSVAINGGRVIDPSLDSWLDDTVEPLSTYQYSLVVIGEDGVEHRSSSEQVTTPARMLALEQNVPNPFNPSTTISFVIPVAAPTVLAVFDVSGALVRVLIDDVMPVGRGTIQWDGTNKLGESVGSGTYFCRLTVGKQVATRKMLLLK